MAEFIEINTVCDVLQIDGYYMDAAVAEMLIEFEGEPIYLLATWDGWSVSYSANLRGEFEYLMDTDISRENQNELDIIKTGEFEDYFGDEEAILDSRFADGYKQLANVLKAKIIEVGLETEESVQDMPFWPE